MKGIITDYIEDKGFGFLKDENEEKRFFHIKSIREQNRFLENLTNYYYTDWEERICYVVDFKPTHTAKGLNAEDIHLTRQIFNYSFAPIEYDATISDITYDQGSLTRLVSGISKDKSTPLGATAGGNGTYRLGYPEVIKELNIRFRRADDIGWGTIDVRDVVLHINGKKKITGSLVQALRDKLVGKTTAITQKGRHCALKDQSILRI
jgi:hypothetical protein